MKKRLLVAGGAGFIGANFVRYMLEQDKICDIIVLDKLTYAGNKENLKGLPSNRLELVVGDIQDKEIVEELVQRVDIVINFAAESHNDRSLDEPEIFIQTNVLGTLTLIEACVTYDKRYHHISTDEVYGDLPLDNVEKFTEKSPYKPSSPYSASKASSDMLVQAWVRSFSLKATISNCSNNYGPYQHVEKFIPRQITSLATGKPITLYGDGKNVRDWLHVKDHARAIWQIIKKGKLGETYLIGANCEYDNDTVAKEISKMMNQIDKIRYVKDRPGHDRRYAIDASKITQELGWQPLYTDFSQGLEETIKWYQNNQAWWKRDKALVEAYYEQKEKV